jgi:hypothetical protein
MEEPDTEGAALEVPDIVEAPELDVPTFGPGIEAETFETALMGAAGGAPTLTGTAKQPANNVSERYFILNTIRIKGRYLIYNLACNSMKNTQFV